jgi:uncharacterized protein (TIGR02466 family)
MIAIVQSSAQQRFEAARGALEQGRPQEAVNLLAAVLQAEPRNPPSHHLLGLALMQLGDVEGAERALRASISFDKKKPAVYVGLSEALQRRGQAAEAEKVLRAALAVDRRHRGTVLALSQLLMALGRPAEALQVTAPLAVAADAPYAVLDLHAEALQRLGRLEEAVAMSQRAIAAGGPFSTLALAACYRELGRYEDAEAAVRKAFDTAGDHPAVWSSLARSLQDLGRHDEAEEAFRRALERAPFDPGAHQGLAELLWAKTADPERAARPLESVLAQRPTPHLLALRARLFNRAGKPEEAYALLERALAELPGDPLLHAAAATAAVHAGRAEEGLAHAEQAHAAFPGSPSIRALLVETCLAAGEAPRAADLVEGLLAERPYDQQHLALQATAWRLMGDPRYGERYDYAAMVGEYVIEPPPGWASLEAFLADLATTLKGMHALRGDPLDQSLRKGTQTQVNLVLSSDPVLKAFFGALDRPVAEHVARLGKGRDPLRARNTGGHRIKAAWSVKLEPDGFHVDHVHPDGWLSSAFYVELPGAIDQGREGWLKFGQPAVPTRPPLEPEHFVKPAPGKLVLFPSYMWHGTVPFSGEETRLTAAFDVVPGK